MAIYFKFNSWNQANYDTVLLDGNSLVVSVSELKGLILKKKKMDKATSMVITNSQTGEEYSDMQFVPKNASVVVRVVPTANQPSNASRMPQMMAQPTMMRGMTSNPMPTSHAEDDFKPIFGAAPIEGAPSTEDEKLNSIINQAADFTAPPKGGFRPTGMQKKIPPQGYVCFRCGQQGHFIYDCPTNGDPAFNFTRKAQPQMNLGIPKIFLKPGDVGYVYQPNEAAFKKSIYSSGLTKEIAQSGQSQPLPPEFSCPICKELMKDAVILKCCTESTCDSCIRNSLTENNFTCPLCKKHLTPDHLLPNTRLRKTIEHHLHSAAKPKAQPEPMPQPPVQQQQKEILVQPMPSQTYPASYQPPIKQVKAMIPAKGVRTSQPAPVVAPVTMSGQISSSKPVSVSPNPLPSVPTDPRLQSQSYAEPKTLPKQEPFPRQEAPVAPPIPMDQYYDENWKEEEYVQDQPAEQYYAQDPYYDQTYYDSYQQSAPAQPASTSSYTSFWPMITPLSKEEFEENKKDLKRWMEAPPRSRSRSRSRSPRRRRSRSRSGSRSRRRSRSRSRSRDRRRRYSRSRSHSPRYSRKRRSRSRSKSRDRKKREDRPDDKKDSKSKSSRDKEKDPSKPLDLKDSGKEKSSSSSSSSSYSKDRDRESSRSKDDKKRSSRR